MRTNAVVYGDSLWNSIHVFGEFFGVSKNEKGWTAEPCLFYICCFFSKGKYFERRGFCGKYFERRGFCYTCFFTGKYFKRKGAMCQCFYIGLGFGRPFWKSWKTLLGCDWKDPRENWLGFERPFDLFKKNGRPFGLGFGSWFGQVEAKHVRTIMSPSETFFKQHSLPWLPCVWPKVDTPKDPPWVERSPSARCGVLHLRHIFCNKGWVW